MSKPIALAKPALDAVRAIADDAAGRPGEDRVLAGEQIRRR